MNQNEPEHINPWYKEFWPWFIIGLLGTVMIACLNMVYLAASGADQVVSDNYYKEGLKINKALEKDQHAAALNLAAFMSVNGNAVEIVLNQPVTDKLVLNFIHPIEQKKDFSLILSSDDKQHFSTELLQSLSGRWHVEISDENDRWRLKAQSNNMAAENSLSFNSGSIPGATN